MNITVKKLVTFRTTDMDGCDCDVYINNVKVGQAHDDGNGGELDFRHDYTPKAKQLVKDMEAYATSLPLRNGKWKVTVEDLINEAIDKVLNERAEKKISE